MDLRPSTVETAKRLQQLLMESSAQIEEYTRASCPACSDVCCRQKHGVYRERDIVYLQAIGAIVPEFDPSRHPDETCEFLGSGGCIHPRWLRPFKCTWYFCEPLLRAMEEQPARSSRSFTAMMKEMIGLYDRLGG